MNNNNPLYKNLCPKPINSYQNPQQSNGTPLGNSNPLPLHNDSSFINSNDSYIPRDNGSLAVQAHSDMSFSMRRYGASSENQAPSLDLLTEQSPSLQPDLTAQPPPSMPPAYLTSSFCNGVDSTAYPLQSNGMDTNTFPLYRTPFDTTNNFIPNDTKPAYTPLPPLDTMYITSIPRYEDNNNPLLRDTNTLSPYNQPIYDINNMSNYTQPFIENTTRSNSEQYIQNKPQFFNTPIGIQSTPELYPPLSIPPNTSSYPQDPSQLYNSSLPYTSLNTINLYNPMIPPYPDQITMINNNNNTNTNNTNNNNNQRMLQNPSIPSNQDYTLSSDYPIPNAVYNELKKHSFTNSISNLSHYCQSPNIRRIQGAEFNKNSFSNYCIKQPAYIVGPLIGQEYPSLSVVDDYMNKLDQNIEGTFQYYGDHTYTFSVGVFNNVLKHSKSLSYPISYCFCIPIHPSLAPYPTQNQPSDVPSPSQTLSQMSSISLSPSNYSTSILNNDTFETQPILRTNNSQHSIMNNMMNMNTIHNNNIQNNRENDFNSEYRFVDSSLYRDISWTECVYPKRYSRLYDKYSLDIKETILFSPRSYFNPQISSFTSNTSLYVISGSITVYSFFVQKRELSNYFSAGNGEKKKEKASCASLLHLSHTNIARYEINQGDTLIIPCSYFYLLYSDKGSMVYRHTFYSGPTMRTQSEFFRIINQDKSTNIQRVLFWEMNWLAAARYLKTFRIKTDKCLVSDFERPLIPSLISNLKSTHEFYVTGNSTGDIVMNMKAIEDYITGYTGCLGPLDMLLELSTVCSGNKWNQLPSRLKDKSCLSIQSHDTSQAVEEQYQTVINTKNYMPSNSIQPAMFSMRGTYPIMAGNAMYGYPISSQDYVMMNQTPTHSSNKEEWDFSCICGKQGKNYDDGTRMVECPECKYWSHTRCENISDNSNPPDDYICTNCKRRHMMMSANYPAGEMQMNNKRSMNFQRVPSYNDNSQMKRKRH